MSWKRIRSSRVALLRCSQSKSSRTPRQLQSELAKCERVKRKRGRTRGISDAFMHLFSTKDRGKGEGKGEAENEKCALLKGTIGVVEQSVHAELKKLKALCSAVPKVTAHTEVAKQIRRNIQEMCKALVLHFATLLEDPSHGNQPGARLQAGDRTSTSLEDKVVHIGVRLDRALLCVKSNPRFVQEASKAISHLEKTRADLNACLKVARHNQGSRTQSGEGAGMHLASEEEDALFELCHGDKVKRFFKLLRKQLKGDLKAVLAHAGEDAAAGQDPRGGLDSEVINNSIKGVVKPLLTCLKTQA